MKVHLLVVCNAEQIFSPYASFTSITPVLGLNKVKRTDLCDLLLIQLIQYSKLSLCHYGNQLYPATGLAIS